MPKNTLSMAVIALCGVVWFTLSPPRFWLNWVKQVEPRASIGAQLIEKYECRSCHHIGGQGALKAPKLSGMAERMNSPSQETLLMWLQNPKAVKADTAMPNFHLSDSEISAIIAYLNEQ